MGLFVAMSGVMSAEEDVVVKAVQAFAKRNKGSLQEAKLTVHDEACLVVSEGARGVTVLYPGDFFDWDDASQFLSKQLKRPVFSLHIHDGDLWMYVLFADGVLVDQFNPIPDYWQELDAAERRTWRGNASKVAKCVPGLKPEQVSKYLVAWDDEVFESDVRKKAYRKDQFHYGDDWQLIDFMSKLGLDYPMNKRGDVHGKTYRFECKPRSRR